MIVNEIAKFLNLPIARKLLRIAEAMQDAFVFGVVMAGRLFFHAHAASPSLVRPRY